MAFFKHRVAESKREAAPESNRPICPDAHDRGPKRKWPAVGLRHEQDLSPHLRHC